jgi:signal transduction histidine kinase/HPt (histidine-containing phosphotransfer) domain-containing protein
MLIIMLVCVVALLLSGVSVVCLDLMNLRRSLSRDLATVAEILGDNSTSALAFGDNRAASEVLRALQAEPRVVAACMYTYEGEPFATYVRPGDPSGFVPPKVRRESDTFESGRLMKFHEIKLHGQTVGTIFIESDLDGMRQRLRNYGAVVTLVIFTSSLLAYFLASRLQNMFSRPVLELVRTAEQISKENNYALRAAGRGNDEFGVLVTAFNGMLDEIQRRDQELESQQAELQGEVEARTAVNLQLETAKGTAEAANKIKGEFLANMSHEIRTPINGILGMIELALATQLTVEQREYLLMVRSSAISLLAIINDILDFSKVESGKLEVESIAFDLHSCVGETMKMLAVQAQEKNLQLFCDIDPEVPRELLGDPGRLRQVIFNLAGNALKFTETGEVLIKIDRISTTGPQVELHFKVSDTGIGIALAKQAILFQAFHQADGSITRKYGGTGLGLAICAGLVNLMGGKIWVESKEGHGSVFHFTGKFSLPAGSAKWSPPKLRPELPALPKPPIPVFSSPTAEPSTRNLHVLLAEDNLINQTLMIRLLQKLGHTSVLARDGREAVELFSSQAFDVILMDVQMPEMDGLTATARIREAELSTGAHIPIFAITARAMKGDKELCLQGGMDGYITKPILFGDIERALATIAPISTTSALSAPHTWTGSAALDRLGGDEELLREICQIFLRESGILLDRLKQAVTNGDAEGVQASAHSIKGEVGYLGAESVSQTAKKLEKMGQDNNLTGAERLVQELHVEVAQLCADVRSKIGAFQ